MLCLCCGCWSLSTVAVCFPLQKSGLVLMIQSQKQGLGAGEKSAGREFGSEVNCPSSFIRFVRADCSSALNYVACKWP